ncbi:MAG: hypothetical protein J6U98_07560, partial [Abditibacteriota bacterium]|nr:hypothetical protein [Abditibacteriota bacterium]
NSGEGIVTIFREPKKGTTDALFNAFYPCRICVFAEPMNAASDGEVEISGTLVNEDVLKPGTYPARVTISDENGKRIYDKNINYTVTGDNKGFVEGTFTEKVALNGAHEGKYRLRFDLTSGGAASGEEEFYVYDTNIPAINRTVVLAGKDDEFKAMLQKRGVTVKDWGSYAKGDLILATGRIDNLGEVMNLVNGGATCVFFCHEPFCVNDAVPHKGYIAYSNEWVYLKTDIVKDHPFFEGLPKGIMDNFRYREVIRNRMWQDADLPDDIAAVAIDTSFGNYQSGVTLGGYKHGSGMFYINTLWLRERMAESPVCERIVFNIIKNVK